MTTKTAIASALLVATLFATGCLCVYEKDPAPRPALARIENKCRIQIEGFVTGTTDVVKSVGGYSGSATSINGGTAFYGGSSSSVSFVHGKTDEMRSFAEDLFEEYGFRIRGNEKPKYAVVCTIDGPYDNLSKWPRALAIDVPTLLFAWSINYGADAQLKIYDFESGDLLYRDSFFEDYHAVVASPLWMLGYPFHSKMHPSFRDTEVAQRIITRAVDASVVFIGENERK